MSALSDRIAGHVNNVVATKQKELEAWKNFRRAAMSRGGMPDRPAIDELNSAIAEAYDVAHTGMREIDAITRAINEPDMPQQTPAGMIHPKTANALAPRKSAQFTPVPGAGPTTGGGNGGGNGGSYATRRSVQIDPNPGKITPYVYANLTDEQLRESIQKVAEANARLRIERSRREAKRSRE